METINNEKLSTSDSPRNGVANKPVASQAFPEQGSSKQNQHTITSQTATTQITSSPAITPQESLMVGRLLQNTLQKLSQEGLESINVTRALQTIKGVFPSEFSQIQVRSRQAQIDNPAPNPADFKPLSQQTLNSWFNGQVVAASVIKTHTDGTATVVIDKQTVNINPGANSGLKLEVGQRMALTVEKMLGKPVSFALSQAPEQSAKLLNLAESSTSQQRAIPPLLATLDAIIEKVSGGAETASRSLKSDSAGYAANSLNPSTKAYPEAFVNAVRELFSKISSGQQLSSSEGLKQAVTQSGIFLESNLKLTQTDNIDLKSLNHLLKSDTLAADKKNPQPLSQALAQVQKQSIQLSPSINQQINISAENSQALQQALSKPQQAITLSLKSNSISVSKTDLLAALQTIIQISVKLDSKQSAPALANSPASTQAATLASTSSSKASKQLAQAIRRIVMDTSANSLSQEQLKQLSVKNQNLAELGKTMASIDSHVQKVTQNVFSNSKPLVQAVSQAVLDNISKHLNNQQIATLKQNPQSLTALASTLKTVAQVVQALPTPEFNRQAEKLLSGINKSLPDALKLDKSFHIPGSQNTTSSPAGSAIRQTNTNPTNVQPSVATQNNPANTPINAAALKNVALNQAQQGSLNTSVDGRSAQIAQTTVNNPITSQGAISSQNPSTSELLKAEQLKPEQLRTEQIKALKALAETLTANSRTDNNNQHLLTNISKSLQENTDKLLSTQQLNRLAEQPATAREVSMALNSIADKLAKNLPISEAQTNRALEKISQAIVEKADKAQLGKVAEALKTPLPTPKELSLGLHQIIQNIDKKTLENHPQIKLLFNNLSRQIIDNSSQNLSSKVIESLLPQPVNAESLLKALKSLQGLIASNPNSLRAFPGQLTQLLSQDLFQPGQKILNPGLLKQLQQVPASIAELQAKIELMQKVISSPADSPLFQSKKTQLNQFALQQMHQNMAKSFIQNSHNPIPAEQVSQLAKHPRSISQVLSVLQSLNMNLSNKGSPNLWQSHLMQNIQQTIRQTAEQGKPIMQIQQLSKQTNSVSELLQQLKNVTQTVEHSRSQQTTQSNNYPRQFSQVVSQFLEQISEQFKANNQSLMNDKTQTFMRSQANLFTQQMQQLSQSISQALANNPAQNSFNQQAAQDFRVSIQRLLEVLQQLPSSSREAGRLNVGSTGPAASLGQNINPPQNPMLHSSDGSLSETTKDVPIATKTKHAQVLPSQPNANFQVTNLATFQQAFVDQLEGVLSRLIATQASNREQADNNINMALEIPFRFQDKSQVLQLKMSSQDREFDDTGGKIWTANLAFELQSLGPLRIYITLDGKQVAMQFWTESADSQTLLNDNFSLLTERLSQAGYKVAQLGSYLGIPEDAQKEIKRTKQGEVDEHV